MVLYYNVHQILMPTRRKIAHGKLRRGVLERAEIVEQLQTALAKWLEAEHQNGYVCSHKNKPFISYLSSTADPIRPSVVSVIRHLQVHGLYDLFEKNYIKRTREYHEKLFVQSPNPMIFLDVCLDRSAKEVERAHAVLPESSWYTAQRAAESGLLDGHVKELANGGQFISMEDSSLRSLTSAMQSSENSWTRRIWRNLALCELSLFVQMPSLS